MKKILRNYVKYTKIFSVVIMICTFVGCGGKGNSYVYYGSPILPLMSTSETSVEVERNINFDFSTYEELKSRDFINTGSANIIDQYELINPTNQSTSIELVYAFEGQFIDDKDEIPLISINGNKIEAKLVASVDGNAQIHNATSWETYSKVLQENDFLSEALASPVNENTSISVYHIYNIQVDHSKIVGDIFWDFQCDKKDNTLLWVRDYDVFVEGTKEDRPHVFFNIKKGDIWLYALGGELSDISISANLGYEITERSQLSGVTYKIDLYKSTLGECMSEYANVYDFWKSNGEGYENAGILTKELLIDGALKRISNMEAYKKTNKIHRFAELFDSVVTHPRMLYWVFPVEIPAGSKSVVSISYKHIASEGSLKKQNGYDVATHMNSKLNFTEQSISISNYNTIKIANQNIGLDPESGVTVVVLNQENERYYIDILWK